MSGPQDPNYTTSTGLAVDDAGTAAGKRLSAAEEGAGKSERRPARFWLALAALLVGLATLAIVYFFFPTWPNVLIGEGVSAGLALLAVAFLLVTGAWRSSTRQPSSASPVTTAERPGAATPAAAPTLPESAPIDQEPAIPASATLEAAPALVSETIPTPAPAAEPAAPEAAPPPEAAPARKAARPRTGPATSNGHSGELKAVRPKTQASSDEPPVSRPALTALPQSYPRPTGGFALDTDAEDLSQLLGDIADQTVLALATRGQRGIERRERMASKIDAFSQEMAVDPDYAPVVAYLESISALLRAGKPIPAARALVDPFDGLYEYVLTLIRRKTGKTQD